MEAVSTSERYVSFYETAQRNIPENNHLNTCAVRTWNLTPELQITRTAATEVSWTPNRSMLLHRNARWYGRNRTQSMFTRYECGQRKMSFHLLYTFWKTYHSVTEIRYIFCVQYISYHKGQLTGRIRVLGSKSFICQKCSTLDGTRKSQRAVPKGRELNRFYLYLLIYFYAALLQVLSFFHRISHFHARVATWDKICIFCL
jgi:hypothetical protein